MVDNAPALACLQIVEALGDRRGLWLKKMEAEVRASVEEGVQVGPLELTNLMRQCQDDARIGTP